jgi:hypothetical protein
MKRRKEFNPGNSFFFLWSTCIAWDTHKYFVHSLIRLYLVNKTIEAARYRLMENQLVEMSFHTSERSTPQMVKSVLGMHYFPGRVWWSMGSGQKFKFCGIRMIPEDFPFRATVP